MAKRKYNSYMDKLDKGAILRAIDGSFFKEVTVYEKINSTSTFAKEADIGTVIFAAEQTSGRGRSGKSFLSKKGGLYFSLVLPVSTAKEVPLTMLVAVAVSQAINSLAKVETQIKWVNDIYLKGKKLAGILTECLFDKIIVGIGLNFYAVDFGELGQTATSLFKTQKAPFSRAELAVEIIKNIEKLLVIERSQYMEYYKSHSCVLNREVRYFKNGVEFSGKVLDISDDGALIIESEKGQSSITSGEISLKF
ncbi:MAG: biotin--[acetyl-CoA-carboxylase] ligase [Clostridia bacterium]